MRRRLRPLVDNDHRMPAAPGMSASESEGNFGRRLTRFQARFRLDWHLLAAARVAGLGPLDLNDEVAEEIPKAM